PSGSCFWALQEGFLSSFLRLHGGVTSSALIVISTNTPIRAGVISLRRWRHVQRVLNDLSTRDGTSRCSAVSHGCRTIRRSRSACVENGGPAAVLRARLAAAKSRRVNSRRLPAHRPHLKFPVRKCQEHNNDDPSNTPGYEGIGTGQQGLEEGTAEII